MSIINLIISQHDAVVTGLDWGAKTNRIVSCSCVPVLPPSSFFLSLIHPSHDRNAYVWTLAKNPTTGADEWRPMLVILRLDRGATCVAWSPKEDKFAVGSAAKAVAVCYFESENNWWVSKHIKENMNSTITCLDWHPNNVLLAAGGTDNVTRVFSAFVRGLDKREDFANGTAFGDKLPFATLLAEFPVSSWVHAIRWSPSGNQLAWATHDSYVYFLECATKNHSLQALKYSFLPFRDLLFIDENRLVAVGHDCAPLLFSKSSQWAFDRNLDAPDAAGAGPGKVRLFFHVSAPVLPCASS